MIRNFVYSDRLLVWITAFISLGAFLFFYLHGQQHLSYYDAIARLNTARKMIDSVTPGVGQLGGIWLPFPQALMVPFIWNDFLWRTGIAGYIISGSSFVIGAVYLQKAVYVLTKKRKISLLIWFLFVSNVNILLLQTMAMSESFFFCFFILTIYYLVLWIQRQRIGDYLLCAISVMALTLTRYEGYFILLGVFIVIFIECVRRYTLRNKERIEGMVLLFGTLAGFGIILWSIYSALFYKDPFFWMHAYTPVSPEAIAANRSLYNQDYGIINPTLWQSLEIFSSVSLWTSGVFTVIMGLIGILWFIVRPVRLFLPLLIISLTLFVLLVVGYYKGFVPHIEFPVVYLGNIREWHVYADNNVRYGMVLLPCLLFFAAFAASRSKLLFIICLLFAFEQLFFSIYNPQLFQYPFYKSWRYPQVVDVPWFRDHYDGGLVLIAASRHEPFMFQSGIDYKNYIYEGTRDYWNDSMIRPSKHATWVIYDDGITNESVTYSMTKAGLSDIQKNYDLVYKRMGFHVYKLRNLELLAQRK
jgi:hypothetical protein